ATPLKYGIKQLKRIGVIQFRREPGRDYWGDRGYDDYVGL
ncbi:MAG: molybdopterin-binding oxidoreductase, partial [Acidimicrobiaceae bacterium]|nr:molybdopterin-binding oxidoreductase [Acidimicrobiaceae bacterium]